MKAVVNLLQCGVIWLGLSVFSGSAHAASCDDFTNVDVKKLRSSQSVNLCEFKDKPLLIVNTASNCGFTPQFKELEALHQEYKDKGLVVLGFSSDSFYQEEDDEADAAKVCFINYGVTFTMFSTVDVTGDEAHPIFKHLSSETRKPSWNFNKYLVSKDRKKIQHFGSRVKPSSEELKKAVEASL
jgi:glutathione peroxidase